MTRFFALLLRLAAAALLLAPAPAAIARERGFATVRLETSEGPILIRLDMKRAPLTSANFLRYVEAKRFDDTSFYRAARNKKAPRYGLVQGGINRNARRTFAPIPHEPTSRTGLRHLDGTVSMARNAPGTAMGDFFITVGTARYLDARDDYAGYAAFGQVVEGMDVVRKILAKPTYPGGWSANTKGQSIVQPVRILRARRIA